MPFGDLNKIRNFKYRFITTLNYLGTDNAKRALQEIENLPDLASDGFHDAYLTSKLISITLTYITKEEFKKFKSDPIRTKLLAVLFGLSDIEEQKSESIDNIFIYCSENPGESLEESLNNFLEDSDLKPFEEHIEDLIHLKSTCDSFCVFYETNKADIEMIPSIFLDTINIKNVHKIPQSENFQNTIYLSKPEEKHIMEHNGSLMINNLKPCLGLLIIAENQNGNLACSAYHHLPSYNSTKIDDHLKHLSSEISKLTDELAKKEYTNRIRLFITGSNLYTFPLALKLTMNYWNKYKEKHIADVNVYLFPSPQNCWSYSLVKLTDSICSIEAGSELYDNDRSLCAERGIYFYSPELDTDSEEYSNLGSSEEQNSQSSEESSDEISIDHNNKYKRNGFFNLEKYDTSSDEAPPTKKCRFG